MHQQEITTKGTSSTTEESPAQALVRTLVTPFSAITQLQDQMRALNQIKSIIYLAKQQRERDELAFTPSLLQPNKSIPLNVQGNLEHQKMVQAVAWGAMGIDLEKISEVDKDLNDTLKNLNN